MKHLPLAVLILLLASCGKDKHKNSLAVMGLKGKVKTMEVLEVRVQKKSAHPDEDSIISKSTYQFNNRGEVAVEFTWLPNDHHKKSLYRFTEGGKPWQLLKYSDDSTLFYKATYTYNKEGQLTEQAQYDGRDTLNMRILYTYDRQGNKTEENAWWSNGKMLSRCVFTYDAKGLEVGRSFYNADSSPVLRMTSYYNDSGFKTREQRFGEDDKEGWEVNYTYQQVDKNGNWLKRSTWRAGKEYSITTRTIAYY